MFSRIFTRYINLAFVLLFSISAFGNKPDIPNQGQFRAQPQLMKDFDLISSTDGWVLLGQHLMWTSDAGISWNEISPVVPANATIQDVKFIDFNLGWMLWTTINDDGSSNFIIAHTTDHGTTWNTITPALFEAGEIAAHSESASMGWFDAQVGWIAVKQASSPNFSLGTLFTTSDGGQTWTRSALPVAD